MRWAELRDDLTSTRTIGAIGLARLGFGTAMALRPSLLPAVLGVDADTARGLDWTVRMVGGREIALGLGGLRSTAGGHHPAPWLLAQAIADGSDAAALALAAREGKVRPLAAGLVIAFAVGGALFEVAAAVTCRLARADEAELPG